MLVQLKDRFADWINVGRRRAVVMIFYVIGLLLAPFWFTLGAYFMIRHDMLQESYFSLWTPVFVGMAGSLLLPIERLSTRLLVAIAYAPVSAILLMSFSITVGCLMIGSCL